MPQNFPFPAERDMKEKRRKVMQPRTYAFEAERRLLAARTQQEFERLRTEILGEIRRGFEIGEQQEIIDSLPDRFSQS
jgi:hypothetical protein